MTYELTHFGKTRRGIPGVPWRTLSDEEYASAVEKHPGMEEQGYFVKVEEVAEAPTPRRSRRSSEPDETPATPPAEEEVTDG